MWCTGCSVRRTDLDNLVLLCRAHHMSVHEDGFTVHARSRQHRWIFRRKDSTPIAQSPELTPGAPLGDPPTPT